MRLPVGGPYDLPPCLSSSASMLPWNDPGVVANEKFIFLIIFFSASNESKNMYAVLVLAVPDPPNSSTGVSLLLSCPRM